MPKAFEFRPASAADIAQCIEIRGMTRENAVSASRLNAMGITLESWRGQVKADSLPGVVCVFERRIVGYCFGDRLSGEIVVLALLPEFEDRGIGRTLLEQTVEVLIAQGHARLYLGCSPDPNSRSYGFYRHLGWRTTNRFDENQDEILELHVKARSVARPSFQPEPTDCKMPLSRFTYIVKAPGYSPDVHRAMLTSEHFTTTIIGVADLACAIRVAQEQARSGTQLIELCGGFTQAQAREVRLQLPSTIPVGAVAYTPEEEAQMARPFA